MRPGLRVLHRWAGERDSGVAEYNVDEFLERPSAARDAWVSLLFEGARVEA
jgi:hypothetical protein